MRFLLRIIRIRLLLYKYLWHDEVSKFYYALKIYQHSQYHKHYQINIIVPLIDLIVFNGYLIPACRYTCHKKCQFSIDLQCPRSLAKQISENHQHIVQQEQTLEQSLELISGKTSAKQEIGKVRTNYCDSNTVLKIYKFVFGTHLKLEFS